MLQEEMPEWIEYDYAVVRVAPRVHVGVFANIGIVIHARQQEYLDVRFAVDHQRILSLSPTLNLTVLDRTVEAYARVCKGGADAGSVGLLPPSERFHWLTAPRSAVLQVSAVHPGRCRNLEAELARLFAEQCQGD